MKKASFLLCIALHLIGASCQKDGVLKDNSKKAAELRKMPDTVKADNREFYINTHVWRDFMPGPSSKQGGNPLMCVTELHAKDGNSMPTNIELKKISVVNGDEIWIMKFEKSQNRGKYYYGTVGNGPRLEIGIMVDVICEFTLGGKTFKVQAKQQIIESTS